MTTHAKLMGTSALIGALWASSPVLAQAPAAPSVQIEEIIVTARKREERLQDVPVAVTAFSPAFLARNDITGFQSLDGRAPNLLLQQNAALPGATIAYIRGVGQDDSTFTAEQGVGLYVDNIIIPRLAGTVFDFLDPERIEVLRGPQGTLYGRNSTTGAIKISSRRPSLDEIDATVQLTTGSLARFDARASVSLPLVKDELAIRLDYVHRQNRSFYRDLATVNRIKHPNSLNRDGVRGSLLWQPAGDFHLYATIDYTLDTSGILLGTPILAGTPTRVFPLGDVFNTTHTLPNNHRTETGGAMVEMGYDLGAVELKSVTGYRRLYQPLNVDFYPSIPGVIAPATVTQTMRQQQFSEDLQLSSSSGEKLNFVAGLFYFHERVGMVASNFFQNTFNDNEQTSNSYAVYGEVSYKLTPQLTATVGGRYSRDEKVMTTSASTISTGQMIFNNLIIPVSFSDFSPKASLDWRPSENAMFYASFARGYKPGGFNSGRPSTAARAVSTYFPERVATYEGGFKSDWFDRKLQINASYFYSDYTDLSLSFGSTIAGIFQFSTLTADVTIKGLEVEVVTTPLPGLQISASYGGLSTKYTKIPVNPVTGVNLGGLTSASKLKAAPEDTVNLAATYTTRLFNNGELTFNANANYQGLTFRNVANSPLLASPARTIVDGQVSYEVIGGRWRFAIGGKNLTDKRYWTAANTPFTVYFAPARTWYLDVRFKL